MDLYKKLGLKDIFTMLKYRKEIGNHTFTLSAMGAPQKHGQRGYKSTIYEYDTTYANSLGIGDSLDYSTYFIIK